MNEDTEKNLLRKYYNVPLRATPSDPLIIQDEGADFIGINLHDVRIPESAWLTVSALHGGESHEHTHRQINRAGTTSEGWTRFALLSVSGGAAVLEVIDPWHEFDETVHWVLVGSHDRAAADGDTDGEPQPSDIIGPDERRRAKCFKGDGSEKYAHSRAVVRIVNRAGYEATVGTAWRVSDRNFLLTNNHMIMKRAVKDGPRVVTPRPDEIELWFGWEHLACEGSATAAVPVKVNAGALLKGSPLLNGQVSGTLDYHLITASEAGFEQIGSFGHLELDTAPPRPGREIYIPQVGTSPTLIAADRSASVTAIITGVRDSVPPSRSDTQYDCDTQGGSSGSPVISVADNRVIALHSAAGTGYNTGAKISDIWPEIHAYFDVEPEPEPPSPCAGRPRWNKEDADKDRYGTGSIVIDKDRAAPAKDSLYRARWLTRYPPSSDPSNAWEKLDDCSPAVPRAHVPVGTELATALDRVRELENECDALRQIIKHLARRQHEHGQA
ncbi:serine protease [Streptomyces lavendulae]|uniref:trypsin-like serine peptidase n=1 Tax=Streptomyces lavendulae TaxID=1914 RepID=UPI0031F09B32